MDKYEKHARETLPEGCVFLGIGESFESPHGISHDGFFISTFSDDNWDEFSGASGDINSLFYAVPKDSETARINGYFPDSSEEDGSSVTPDDDDGDEDDEDEVVELEVAIFPDDTAERKTYPVCTGLLEYFPHALAAVAHQSYLGNQQHHPDKPLHWDKSKSADESDALIRHQMEGDYVAVAWRALAQLERYLTNTEIK